MIGFTPSTTAQQEFVIINNDGADPVTGTFRTSGVNRPEGSLITVSGSQFFISYHADSATVGTGNDVALYSQPIINGTPGADTVTITPADALGNITVSYSLDNGTITDGYTTTTPPNNFSFYGGGGDDTLNVIGNAFSALPGGITYDGETQTPPGANPAFGDVLHFQGDGTQTATYLNNATIPGAGTVMVTGYGTTTFTGLEPVNIFGMAVANVTLAGADDIVSITNGFGATVPTAATAALVVSGMSNAVAFESVHLSGNALVNVNTTTVSGNDSVTITSAFNAHANARLQINTGTGTDSVTVNGDATFTGDATAATADIEIDSQSIVFGATGSLTVSAANGLVDLNAGGGTITSPGTATADVIANSLVATANAGIGTGAARLLTTVANLSAVATTTGNIFITETDGVDISAGGLSTGSGNISLSAGGAVTQTGTITTTGGLELLGAGSYALNNAANNVGTIAANTTNTIDYTDADGLIVGTVNTVGITSGGNDVALHSSGLTINQAVATGAADFRIDSSAAVTQAAAGAITATGLLLTGTGAFTLNGPGNAVTTLATSTTLATGTVEFSQASALIVGSVTMFANPAVVGITTAADVALHSVGLTISNAIATGAGDLRIDSSAAVTQTAAISGTGLQLTDAGPFTLDNVLNNFVDFAADTTGVTRYTDAGALEVDAVTVLTNTETGVTVMSANLFLTTGGLLNLAEDITVTIGFVSLNSAGGATQGSGDTIGAPRLVLLGAGTFTLNDAANNVNVLAADLNAGSLDYADTNDLQIDVVNGTTGINSGNPLAGGNVTINTGGVLTVDQTINTTTGTGGVVTVGGNVVLNAALVPGAGNITLNATTPTGTLVVNSPQSLPTINWSATVNIIINAAVTTTVGSLSLTADSDTNGTGGVLITTNGSLNSAAALSISGGDLADDAYITEQFGTAAYLLGDFSVVVENGAATEIMAVGNVTISGNASVTTSDIQLDGQIQNAGALTTLTSQDDIILGSASSITNTNVAGVTSLTAGASSLTSGDINGSGLITSATIDLNADAGIGDSTPLNLVATTITADTANGNIDLNNNQAGATLVDSLTTGTGSILFDQTGGGAVTFDPATTTNGPITLRATAGNLIATSVSAGGMNNVQLTTLTSGNVTVGAVAAANTVFVDSAGTILDDGSNTTLIVASTADLDAAGDIGASGNQIDTTVMFLTALATGGSIFVDETDGLTVTSATATGGSNDITIRSLAATPGNILVGTITAPDVVTLAALNGSILEDTADTATDIAASDAQLSATGSIGASTANGDLDTALATLTAGSTTAGGIYLTDTDGLTVTSATTTAGDIYLDAARAAAGNLTATLVTAAGTGADVRLRTLTAGSDILLGDVTATDNVAVHALGLITDSLAGEVNPAANANVTATSLVLISTGGVGNTDDIDTAVTYLAAAGGTGDVRVTNSGPLTITSAKAAPAGVEFTALPGIPDTTGVTGNGTGEITALSPLTVAANTIMGASVTLTASDDVAAGDILTVNSGITVQSLTSTVTLNAGDGVNLIGSPAASVIDGFTGVSINVDNIGGLGAGSGSSSTLAGTIRTSAPTGANHITITSGDGLVVGDSFTQTGSITASGTGDITISLGAGNDQYDAASTATAVLTALDDTITINGNNGDDMILLGDQFFAATISATDTFLNGNDATNAPDGSDTFKVRASSTTSFRIDGDDPTTPIPGDTLWVDLTGVTGPVNEEHGDPTTTISFPAPNTQKQIVYQEIENRQTTGSTGTPLVNHIFDLLDYPLVTDGVFDVQLTNPGNLEVALNGVIVYTGDDDTVNSLTFGGKDGSNDAVRIHASATGELPSEGGVVGFGLDVVGTLPGLDAAGTDPAGTTRKSVSTAFTANGRTSAGLLSGAPAPTNRPGLYFDGRGGTNSIVLDVTTARDVAYLSDNQTGFGVGQGDLSVNSSLLSPTLRGFAATFANVNSVHLREMTASGSKLLIDASSTPLTTAISVVDIADPTTTAQYDALNPVNNTTAPLGGGASITFVGASQLVGTVPAPLTNPNVLPTRFAGFADVTIRSGGFVAPATAATGGETLDLISIDATGLIAPHARHRQRDHRRSRHGSRRGRHDPPAELAQRRRRPPCWGAWEAIPSACTAKRPWSSIPARPPTTPTSPAAMRWSRTTPSTTSWDRSR